MHPEPKNDTEVAWSERRQVKKGAKKMKPTEAEKERGELSPVPRTFPRVPVTSRHSLLSEGLEQASVRKQPTFRDVTAGFPQNDV